jgi:hypothetical protein
MRVALVQPRIDAIRRVQMAKRTYNRSRKYYGGVGTDQSVGKIIPTGAHTIASDGTDVVRWIWTKVYRARLRSVTGCKSSFPGGSA